MWADERLRQSRTIRQHAERCLMFCPSEEIPMGCLKMGRYHFQTDHHLHLAEILIHGSPSGWGTIGLFEDRLYTIFKLTPVNLQFLQANLLKNSFAIALTHLCGIALMIVSAEHQTVIAASFGGPVINWKTCLTGFQKRHQWFIRGRIHKVSTVWITAAFHFCSENHLLCI